MALVRRRRDWPTRDLMLEGATLETTLIPATAGNAGVTTVVPAGQRWKFLSSFLALVCDATVISRRFDIEFRDAAGNMVFGITSYTGITAGQTRYGSFAPTCNFHTTFPVDTQVMCVPLDMVLPAGYQIYVRILAGVAGDSWSGALYYAVFR